MERGTASDEKVVVFTVGGQEYALPIAGVREILTWTAPTPVPDAPPFVEGVISVRGEVLPVVNLGRRFGLPSRREVDQRRIIVLEMDGQTAGLIVDDVVAVEDVAGGRMAPVSPLLASFGGPDAAVVEGILQLGEGRLVVVLAPARVLETALQ
ncbi:MAG: chemotaxis protein CheW [Bacillota bacterium]|nr:MAG: chemotaxis protein CheW [Bacillota bacterium]